MQGQLRDVREIFATRFAFAALLGDGSVVTWGHPKLGGDSSAVKEQLCDWALVRGFNLNYHNKETILFTIDLYYGNLN